MFSAPKKTSDGRYYVKATEKKLIQLNGVTLSSSIQGDSAVTFQLDPVSFGKVSEMDDVIITSAKENSELWFQRKVADKTIEAAYVRPADTMNVSSVPGSKVYRNKEAVDPASVTEGSVCDIVLEFSGVWCVVSQPLSEEKRSDPLRCLAGSPRRRSVRLGSWFRRVSGQLPRRRRTRSTCSRMTTSSSRRDLVTMSRV
jgi:hypothetical protein